jgi:NAD(P)-dependent dehydrogenase (short-subunit alcohol dehydrogenase family)
MSSVLVTGASRGIGRGLVAAFASAGWDVVVTARREDDAARVAAETPGSIGCPCDVTVAGEVEAAVETALAAFGGLDAFVHNPASTGSAAPVDLEHAPAELWDDQAAVALRGLWRGARAAFGPLRDRGGSLLVLTSPAGIEGSPDRALYAAVKGGQLGFVRRLAPEWAPHGVRVNGLAPLARTPALEHAFREDPALEERLTRIVPLGRLGDPELDIGPPAVFLCGEGARYITGQNLVVSGGRFIGS